MTVWRQLLRRPAELLNQNGRAAIDATYFDRQQASSHYLRRIDRSVKAIQTTFFVDTAEGAILDLHCSTKWPDETKIGDRGSNDMSFREELRNAGIQPLIKHRVFAPYDHAHNARIDGDLYGQRSQTESVNSSIKRSHGSAV